MCVCVCGSTAGKATPALQAIARPPAARAVNDRCAAFVLDGRHGGGLELREKGLEPRNLGGQGRSQVVLLAGVCADVEEAEPLLALVGHQLQPPIGEGPGQPMGAGGAGEEGGQAGQQTSSPVAGVDT